MQNRIVYIANTNKCIQYILAWTQKLKIKEEENSNTIKTIIDAMIYDFHWIPKNNIQFLVFFFCDYAFQIEANVINWWSRTQNAFLNTRRREKYFYSHQHCFITIISIQTIYTINAIFRGSWESKHRFGIEVRREKKKTNEFLHSKIHLKSIFRFSCVTQKRKRNTTCKRRTVLVLVMLKCCQKKIKIKQ